MLELDKIHCGDNCDLLGQLPRECIDLVVTSPPYDDLRTYGGHSWDFFGVAWQLKRVLKPGGVIVWVVADATKDGSETGSSMEQALHFKRLGLNLHDTMIYQKTELPAAERKHGTTSLGICFCFFGRNAENGNMTGRTRRRANALDGRQRTSRRRAARQGVYSADAGMRRKRLAGYPRL
jgi:DNA modification methylase